MEALHSQFLHLNETSLPEATLPTNTTDYYDLPDYPSYDDHECLYEETQLERARYEEEGFYDLELFTHYLSGFGGLTFAIIGLVINSFCAFTLCRAAVFRAHLVFLCAVSIANALQLSCLIVIITRDIRQPDPRYLNLLPRLYIRAFLYLYPLSKFFHLTMAWFVMASTVDCWRWIKKAKTKQEKLMLRTFSEGEEIDISQEVLKANTSRCKVILVEILTLIFISLLALVYTIPAAWENKGDILILGKISTQTNCSAFIYHLMQTELSQTALYRIGYSLLGHLIFQTGIPLVVSSIAIAKISRQLQITSSNLGQLIGDAVNIVLQSSNAGVEERPRLPSPSYTQRTVVENRNIIHCSLFLAVFTFYVCHVPQLWAKIQWSLMHVESHQNSHMKYVNEFVNFMTVANAAINGVFILCFCRRHIATGARDVDVCAWCFGPPKKDDIYYTKFLKQPRQKSNESKKPMPHTSPEEILPLPATKNNRTQFRQQNQQQNRSNLNGQRQYELDVELIGSNTSILSQPVQFSLPAAAETRMQQQQYFTMGPQSNDVYVAAQV